MTNLERPGLVILFTDTIDTNFILLNWKVAYLLPHESDLLPRILPRLDSDVYTMEKQSNGSVAFFELYSIQQTAPVLRNLLIWNPGQTFPKILDKWLRRRDLSAATFKVGTCRDFPFVSYPPDWDFRDEELVSGMAMDVLLAFQTHHGFKMEFQRSIDGEWGMRTGNGSWNGLIGMTSRGEVDLVATSLTPTPERSEGTK